MEDREPEPPDLLFSLDYFQGRVLDPELTDLERVEALESLNNLPLAEARSPEVVDAMLHLLPRIGDAEVLRDAIGHLGRVERPEFRDYLLDAASFHRSRHVREAAAIELTEFKSEPLVASVLGWLSSDDPDRGVRVGAQRALDGEIYGNL
ncbi:MAG: HEAT repeat domain-containing protein, partial [Planctomycetota bacterium]|jgi:HEAT repeat protein